MVWTGCSSRRALLAACCSFPFAVACGRTNLAAMLADDGSFGVGRAGASSSAGTGGSGVGGTEPNSSGGSPSMGGGGVGVNGGGTGGSTATGGSAGTSGAAGAGGATALPEGSFDLQFREFFLEGRPAGAPLVDHLLRVDFFDRGFGLEAEVTPRWGEPVLWDVRAEGSTLVLVGLVSVANEAFHGFEDSLGSIVLPLDGEGRIVLGNTATGQGVERRGEDEVHAFTANGSIDHDRTPPEIRSDSVSQYGPPSALLPWDTVVIRAAEPISAAEIGPAITLTPEGAPMQPITASFGFSPTDSRISFTGITTMTGQLEAWDGLLEGGDLFVTVAGPVPDGSMNLLASDTRIAIPYIHLGSPVSNHTFIRENEVARWGYGTSFGFPPATPERPCDFSTCVEIGPVPAGLCPDRSGIAGILSTFSPAGTSYRIDYSVRADGPFPHQGVVAFRVQTALFGNHAGVTRVLGPELVDLGEEAGELRYTSGPLSVEIPYPTGHVIPGAIGFGIFHGSDDCNDVTPRYSVIIDYIEQ